MTYLVNSSNWTIHHCDLFLMEVYVGKMKTKQINWNDWEKTENYLFICTIKKRSNKKPTQWPAHNKIFTVIGKSLGTDIVHIKHKERYNK